MIPINLPTGFLGAGKTTILNALLRDPRFAQSAVLINEFAKTGIDCEFIVKFDAEGVLHGDKDAYAAGYRHEVDPPVAVNGVPNFIQSSRWLKCNGQVKSIEKIAAMKASSREGTPTQ